MLGAIGRTGAAAAVLASPPAQAARTVETSRPGVVVIELSHADTVAAAHPGGRVVIAVYINRINQEPERTSAVDTAGLVTDVKREQTCRITGLIYLVILVIGLIDISNTDDATVRGLPKFAQVILVVMLPLVGALVWLAVGRPTGDERPRRPSG